MNYVRVKNWERHQHRAEKRLPWIKFFTELLEPTRNLEYSALSDADKCLLHHLWLMASVFNNKIPMDWVTRERLNLKSKVNLTALTNSGYISIHSDDAYSVQSEYESLTHTDTRVARSEFSPSDFSSSLDSEFDKCWTRYPRAIGRKAALSHFRASVQTPADLEAVNAALDKYIIHAAMLEPRFIQHGSTWFNNWRDWVDYTPPPKPAADPSLTLGATPHSPLMERMLDALTAYRDSVARRPGGGAARVDWDAAFEAHFGFTADDWNAGNVSVETIETWLTSGVTR